MCNRSDNRIVVLPWIAFALLGAAYPGLVVDGLFRLAFQQIRLILVVLRIDVPLSFGNRADLPASGMDIQLG